MNSSVANHMGWTETDPAGEYHQRLVKLLDKLNNVPLGRFTDRELFLVMKIRGLYITRSHPLPYLTDADIKDLESKCH
jgi:hypothetical protein